MASHSESEDLPYLDDKEFQAFSSRFQKALQRPEPIMIRKRKNGVSTPLVLNMKPYAHVLSNHGKEKGHYINICNLLWKLLCILNKTIPTNRTCSSGHWHVHHKNKKQSLVKSTCIDYSWIHNLESLSSGYNSNRHEQEYLITWIKQENYPWTRSSKQMQWPRKAP